MRKTFCPAALAWLGKQKAADQISAAANRSNESFTFAPDPLLGVFAMAGFCPSSHGTVMGPTCIGTDAKDQQQNGRAATVHFDTLAMLLRGRCRPHPFGRRPTAPPALPWRYPRCRCCRQIPSA